MDLVRTAVKTAILLLLLVVVVKWGLSRDSRKNGHCSVGVDVVGGGGDEPGIQYGQH